MRLALGWFASWVQDAWFILLVNTCIDVKDPFLCFVLESYLCRAVCIWVFLIVSQPPPGCICCYSNWFVALASVTALNFVTSSVPPCSGLCAHGIAGPHTRDLISALGSVLCDHGIAGPHTRDLISALGLVLVECAEDFRASPLAHRKDFPPSSLWFCCRCFLLSMAESVLFCHHSQGIAFLSFSAWFAACQVHRLWILVVRRSLQQDLVFDAKNFSFPFELVVLLGSEDPAGRFSILTLTLQSRLYWIIAGRSWYSS
jgi:hypothetical protein